MHPPVQTEITNRLLATLAADDFARLAKYLEPVDLPLRFQLADAGEPITQVYFPCSGIGSVVALADEDQAEIGIFGRDGFSPVEAVLGTERSVHSIYMQTAGAGHRIARTDLLAVLADHPAVQIHLLRYVQALRVQTGFTALANAVHPVAERLARWLLMCHDRSDGDEMPLTHDFLSVMLAVRRPSVTTALHVL